MSKRKNPTIIYMEENAARQATVYRLTEADTARIQCDSCDQQATTGINRGAAPFSYACDQHAAHYLATGHFYGLGEATIGLSSESGSPIEADTLTEYKRHGGHAAALRIVEASDISGAETVEVAADLFMALQREARRAALLPDVAEFLQMVVADNQRNRVPSVVEFGARELLARIEAAR